MSETENKHSDMMTKLGRIIRKQRRNMGLSQEELATRAGVHRTYLSDIENGDRNPSLATLANLSEALDIPVYMLLLLVESGGDSPKIAWDKLIMAGSKM